MRTRRTFLGTAGMAVLAGCTGSESDSGGSGGGSTPTDPPDSDGDGVPNSEDDFPDDSTRSVLLEETSETLELNEDYYQYYEFDYSQSVVLDYQVEVQQDVPIDVILTDETNFQYFEDGSEWEYFTDGTDLETLSTSQEVDLSAETTYYLIIDNTSEGGAAPPTNFDNDRLVVDFSAQVYR